MTDQILVRVTRTTEHLIPLGSFSGEAIAAAQDAHGDDVEPDAVLTSVAEQLTELDLDMMASSASVSVVAEYQA